MAAQSFVFRKKSNAEMLTFIQLYYPDITKVSLNLDGSVQIDSSSAFTEGETEDLVQILSSFSAWNALEV